MTSASNVRYFISEDGEIAPEWTCGVSTAEAHESTLKVVKRLARGRHEVNIVGLTREQFDNWEKKTSMFDVLSMISNRS